MLIALNLSKNDITSDGAKALAAALLSSGIKELELKGNPLGN